MTEQEVVHQTPIVTFVGTMEGDEHEIPWDLLIESAPEYQDPATISDPDLLALVANHLDRDVTSFGSMKVDRPETGNILVRPTPSFG